MFGTARKITGLIRGPFAGLPFDDGRFQREMDLPAAPQRYAIFFTPRSGSSWLTDIAIQSRRLARPDECFNPALVPGIALTYNADRIVRYCEMLLRRRNHHGLFGCELTYFHLIALFHGESAFFQRIAPQTLFWLIREDIVAQAVSASRMMQTQVAHRVAGRADGGARTPFRYDARQIRLALWRMRQNERFTEAMFRRRSLIPHRMSYETMFAAGPQAVLRWMMARLDRPGRPAPLAPAHEKLGDALNEDFAARFRQDNPGLIAKLDRDRAAMIAAARLSAESMKA